MRDFCTDFLPAVFDILDLSRQKNAGKQGVQKDPFDRPWLISKEV